MTFNPSSLSVLVSVSLCYFNVLGGGRSVAEAVTCHRGRPRPLHTTHARQVTYGVIDVS